MYNPKCSKANTPWLCDKVALQFFVPVEEMKKCRLFTPVKISLLIYLTSGCIGYKLTPLLWFKFWMLLNVHRECVCVCVYLIVFGFLKSMSWLQNALRDDCLVLLSDGILRKNKNVFCHKENQYHCMLFYFFKSTYFNGNFSLFYSHYSGMLAC